MDFKIPKLNAVTRCMVRHDSYHFQLEGLWPLVSLDEEGCLPVIGLPCDQGLRSG